MNESTQMAKIVLSINKFLSNSKRNIEYKFKNGLYLSVIKRKIKGLPYLEIHTSGYDNTLPLMDAITWIKWELIDMEANGLLKLEKIA